MREKEKKKSWHMKFIPSYFFVCVSVCSSCRWNGKISLLFVIAIFLSHLPSFSLPHCYLAFCAFIKSTKKQLKFFNAFFHFHLCTQHFFPLHSKQLLNFFFVLAFSVSVVWKLKIKERINYGEKWECCRRNWVEKSILFLDCK